MLYKSDICYWASCNEGYALRIRQAWRDTTDPLAW